MSPNNSFALRLLSISVLISLIFGFILSGLTQYSLGEQGTYSAWVIHDDMRQPETAREMLRFIRESLVNTIAEIRDGQHPPLYLLLLDGWTLLFGEGEFILRLPSALLSTLSLAAIYAIGRQIFDTKAGFLALMLFGSAGIFIFYSRDVGATGLYLALGTITFWAYSRWWYHPNLMRGLIYGILLSLMLFTEYSSFLVMLILLVHSLVTIKSWTKQATWWHIMIPYGLASLLFAIWMVVFIDQITFRDDIAHYFILILPILSLLMAFLLSKVRIFKSQQVNFALTLILTGLIVLIQLVTYGRLWSPEFDWRSTVASATERRTASETAIVSLDSASPEFYYARQMGLIEGISIDTGWRDFSPQEIQTVGNSLSNSESVWAILEMGDPENWEVLAVLGDNRGVTYRDVLDDTIFYQFDTRSDEELEFTFGHDSEESLFAYRSDSYANYNATIGEGICTLIQLEALINISDDYLAVVQLVDNDREIITQAEEAIQLENNVFEHEFCLTYPDTETYYLQLTIYAQSNSESLLLMESNFVWGDYLIVGSMEQSQD